MPDEKKTDPFKPQEPAIPGVLPSAPKPESQPPPQEQFVPAARKKSAPAIHYFVLAGVAALWIIAGLIYWSHSSSAKTNSPAADTVDLSLPAAAVATAPERNLPVGPGPIATTEELAKPWSAKRFLFRNLASGQDEPAMVVRLPRGDYWGFSLREPFGTCDLEFISDLDKLRTEYHFRAEHPMVGDPCNHTVYDLLRYGGGASNEELVRGMIVQGTGIRPPMAIEIRAEGNQVIAVRGE